MRAFNTKTDGGAFDEATIEAVWEKADIDPGSSADVFRKDICGATIHRQRYGQQVQWGWEIDHIRPVSEGGTDRIINLRPLHWANNRAKGDRYPDSAWTGKVTE